jgi:putative inorganic carbon (hco3(-)) transporter
MLRMLFVLAILLVGGVAAMWSRFAALLLYLWFAVFRPLEWLWTRDLSAYRPSLWIGLLLVGSCLLTGVLPTLLHPISLGALGFFLSSLLAQHNAVDAALAWSWVDYIGRLILVGMFLVSLTTTRRRLMWVLGVIAGSWAIHSAGSGFFSLSHGIVRFGEGLGGPFSDNNGYGVGSVMVLFLLVPLAQASKGWALRLVWWLAIPLTVVTVISTFSRAAFLAIVVSTLVFVLLQRRRMLATVVLLVLMGVGALFVPIPESYVDRLRTIQTYDQEQEMSALSRLHYWKVGLKMAADNPLGVGLWNYQSYYDRYDTDPNFTRNKVVHNSHLQALTEAGWLGMVMWLALFFTAFRLCFRVRARARAAAADNEDHRALLTVANGLICSMAAFVVGGFFLSMAYNDLTWLTFSVVAAADRLSKSLSESKAGETARTDAAAAAIA